MPGLVGNGTWPECYMSRGSLPLAMYCVVEREKRIDIILLRLRCVLCTVPDPATGRWTHIKFRFLLHP